MGRFAQETGVDEVTDEDFSGLCNVYGFAPSRSLRELLETATAQAAISEREACAKVALSKRDLDDQLWQQACEYCAAAIRARGQA
jgi:uncharacterized protein HemY